MKRRINLVLFLLAVTVTCLAQGAHPEGFRERYTLKQVMVLSRHNIRSPLSGRRSTMQRITPHEWHQWSSAPGELSLRGGALETMMGQYFRKWLVSEGLMKENEIPAEGAMRFYANSLQRTIATAQYFSSGMLPVANVTIEHHCEVGKMDSVFALYQSTHQLRDVTLLDLENPPMVFPIRLKGLETNADGLYPYELVLDRIETTIN